VIATVPGLDRIVAWLMAQVTGDAILIVQGRHSGRLRATNARPITVDGHRYLVAIRGESNWARNLRVRGDAVLVEKGRPQRVGAIEVGGEEQRAVVEAFLATSRFVATRRILTEVLPDPADHPVFRLEPRDLSGRGCE
jgi:hypothetical protein